MKIYRGNVSSTILIKKSRMEFSTDKSEAMHLRKKHSINIHNDMLFRSALRYYPSGKRSWNDNRQFYKKHLSVQ